MQIKGMILSLIITLMIQTTIFAVPPSAAAPAKSSATPPANTNPVPAAATVPASSDDTTNGIILNTITQNPIASGIGISTVGGLLLAGSAAAVSGFKKNAKLKKEEKAHAKKTAEDLETTRLDIVAVGKKLNETQIIVKQYAIDQINKEINQINEKYDAIYKFKEKLENKDFFTEKDHKNIQEDLKPYDKIERMPALNPDTLYAMEYNKALEEIEIYKEKHKEANEVFKGFENFEEKWRDTFQKANIKYLINSFTPSQDMRFDNETVEKLNTLKDDAVKLKLPESFFQDLKKYETWKKFIIEEREKLSNAIIAKEKEDFPSGQELTIDKFREKYKEQVDEFINALKPHPDYNPDSLKSLKEQIQPYKVKNNLDNFNEVIKKEGKNNKESGGETLIRTRSHSDLSSDKSEQEKAKQALIEEEKSKEKVEKKGKLSTKAPQDHENSHLGSSSSSEHQSREKLFTANRERSASI